MDVSDGQITELVSGQSTRVKGVKPALGVDGLDGQALLFDGYSNYASATIPSATLSTTAQTISILLAPQTYPMMNAREAQNVMTPILTNVPAAGNAGFALCLSSQGDWRFDFYTTQLVQVAPTTKLPRGQWSHIVATVDGTARRLLLYLNGQLVAEKAARGTFAISSEPLLIGKGTSDLRQDGFLLNAFCGLIDDIAIYNKVMTADEIQSMYDATLLGRQADFNVPYSYYADADEPYSLWRPQFHGQPAAGWTNETHGMTLGADGRYHLFFQKNANGPYMARLHWGHLSSANLYQWREEPIAIGPSEGYDMKGCWSGCVYEADGTPTILYTGVDNAKAVIAQARATDDSLIGWEKQGIAINGRPAGLSDDFRDPYYFEVADSKSAQTQRYIIVGTSKGGIGACTLHKLVNGAWTNDGSIFFQGTNAAQHGTFWEMPNVTSIGDGRWLFTCTPQNTGAGVRTLCWVGTIDDDGHFTPDTTEPQYLEMSGISRQGYGLLSPTITPLSPPEGGTIVGNAIEAPSGAVGGGAVLLGIVPDKLPTQTNYQMGWAHLYSLPRELSVDANGQLVQRPYSGLTAMRTATTAQKTLNGAATASLAPVSGRQIELLGELSITTGQCGFRFLQSGSQHASLTYDADRKTLTLDLTALRRLSNDGDSFNGVYTASVPETVTRLDVWLDGSILDIFVNNRWAYSVRLFPIDATAVDAEVFSTAAGTVKATAWTLDATQQGSSNIAGVVGAKSANSECYDLQGRRLSTAPARGLFIRDGKKIVR